MLQHSEPALLLAIKPSQRLKLMIILIHALALAASVANDSGLLFKLGLVIIICLHSYLTVKRLKDDYYTIKHTEALGWQISKDHDLVSIEILSSTVVTTFALFLHYKESPQLHPRTTPPKQARLILNDALSNEDFRHLIVKLKITHIK